MNEFEFLNFFFSVSEGILSQRALQSDPLLNSPTPLAPHSNNQLSIPDPNQTTQSQAIGEHRLSPQNHLRHCHLRRELRPERLRQSSPRTKRTVVYPNNVHPDPTS